MKAFQFSIKLKDVSPSVSRTFVVPSALTFEELHMMIQTVMGWQNYHDYEFQFENPRLIIVSNQEKLDELNYQKNSSQYPIGMHNVLEETEFRLASEVLLNEYAHVYQKANYIYDMGDYWEHDITLVKQLGDYDFEKLPIIKQFRSLCPPEDVGGSYGYKDFKRVYNDPDHPSYELMREWAEEQSYGQTTHEVAEDRCQQFLLEIMNEGRD